MLLVVTDGNDNASIINLENLVKEAQNSGVLIYAIGLLTEEERSEAKKAKRALDMLTEATGGEAFYPKGLDEVDRIAHQVAHDLRNQYSIAYSPTNQKLDGSYRQIKVVGQRARTSRSPARAAATTPTAPRSKLHDNAYGGSSISAATSLHSHVDHARTRAAAPWYIWLALLSVTSAMIGGHWDISWHRSIGRDTFWTPAHIAIYLCGVLSGISCGYLILSTTFGKSPAAGLRAPR